MNMNQVRDDDYSYAFLKKNKKMAWDVYEQNRIEWVPELLRAQGQQEQKSGEHEIGGVLYAMSCQQYHEDFDNKH